MYSVSQTSPSHVKFSLHGTVNRRHHSSSPLSQGSALTATELTNSPNQDFGVLENGGNVGEGGEMGK